MSLKNKLLALSAGVILIVTMLAFALPVAASTTTVLDSVNIGETTSESTHDLIGWTSIWTYGPYSLTLRQGDWCDNPAGSPLGGDGSMRLIWGDGGEITDPTNNWASVKLDAGTGNAFKLRVRHLAGAADDGFKVYVNGNDVGTYVDTVGSNTWMVDTFDISSSGLSGILTVKFEATAGPWGGIATYGQVGISQIELLGNLPPVLGAISVDPSDPVKVGTPISAIASFTDPDTADTHIATWDWDYGSFETGVVVEDNGAGTVTGSHTYSSAGVYTVTLAVWDDDGGYVTATYQYVVVYDPSAGFVTGGGWITSPAGAYQADPDMTGKATFGFVSKYQKGANVPVGNTEFQFKAGNLNFHSSSYQWMVIAGAKAQYKGAGTINGSGNYGFMLTAIDGQITGGGGADKFRIKIWDKDDGDAVVYDNKMGSDDTADPDTTLGGGSIVIHTGK